MAKLEKKTIQFYVELNSKYKPEILAALNNYI